MFDSWCDIGSCHIFSGSLFSVLFPICLQYFLSHIHCFGCICFQFFPSVYYFSAAAPPDFNLTRESNSLSDYRKVRLLSLEARLFLYCPHSTTYLSGCNSLVSAFLLLMDPVRGTFTGFGFFFNLIQRLWRDSSLL